ncbi:MAG: hypothetical protein B6I18_04955 [Bacteroidetes bacterium 4572_112]|nr:MAG: hypothetical protein B6I18_04955 [Bacteroidetes bacterium 4572_112]
MQELFDNHKKAFLKQIDNINEKDESLVRNKIDKEIAKLKAKNKSSLSELITKAELLANILQCDEFPIGEVSKKWIIFGLNYLVSDVDLIPDIIPLIGYIDDNLVLAWVIKLLYKDIKRYEQYLKAKNNNSPILSDVVQGNGEQQFVFFPGFFETKNNNTEWVKLVKNIQSSDASPGISIFDRDFEFLKEFRNTLPMIDHKLSLKPIFNSESFGLEWELLKVEMRIFSNKLNEELIHIKKQYPNKEIIAVCLNIGAAPLLRAQYLSDNKLIDSIYLFGATCSEQRLIDSISNKGIKVYNFFSKNDHALKFIYENYEKQNIPTGLGELHSLKTSGVINIDVSDSINKHQEYRYNFAELINNVK